MKFFGPHLGSWVVCEVWVDGWYVRYGWMGGREGEKVRDEEYEFVQVKNKICFVIYFSGEKKKKKILCFVIVK
jgi:hypothetical protein